MLALGWRWTSALEVEIMDRVDFDEIAKRVVELGAMGTRFAVDNFGPVEAAVPRRFALP